MLGLYPTHEIILKVSNNISMNLKKESFIAVISKQKMNENYRQGMRLICCFKICDLVAASRHMILVLNTIVHISFQ